MKKLILIALGIFALATIFGSRAFAQQVSATGNPQTENEIFARFEENKSTAAITEVDKRVLKAFSKANGSISNAQWYKLDKGYAVMFKGNGMRTTIYYANNGVVESRVNYYGEEKLPASVYSLIKSNFPGFTINSVVEVYKNSTLAHHVKLEGKSSVKTVKVIGDEWEVTETLTKI